MTNRSAGAGRDGKLWELIAEWREKAAKLHRFPEAGYSTNQRGDGREACADELESLLAVPDPLASSSETQGEKNKSEKKI